MIVDTASFELECDRLSHVVDEAQFERLRWARSEGPMLARLVELALAAIENRSDFDLVEEGTSRDEKRFVLKIHSMRVASIALGLNGNAAVLQVEATERSKYAVLPGEPLSVDFASIDGPWMTAALQQLFSRIRVI